MLVYGRPPFQFKAVSLKQVVQLIAVRQERQHSQQVLWQRFVDAQRKSQQTLRIEDGIVAGKAYAAYVETFVVKR